jgi:hypothetical protein
MTRFIDSSPGDRTWVNRKNGGGWLVPGVVCPECGEWVLYNGNYFCSEWSFITSPEWTDCHWALAHPALTKADKAICDALGLDHE